MQGSAAVASWPELERGVPALPLRKFSQPARAGLRASSPATGEEKLHHFPPQSSFARAIR